MAGKEKKNGLDKDLWGARRRVPFKQNFCKTTSLPIREILSRIRRNFRARLVFYKSLILGGFRVTVKEFFKEPAPPPALSKVSVLCQSEQWWW